MKQCCTPSTTICSTNGGCSCGECAPLESFCRPRFFPGQLLTEEDLNRLDAYLVGKNRLHNRYLHGDGVVCGLKVTCAPCNGGVQVSAGYAINGCGDDLILPETALVDVCELADACRRKERRPDPCDPPRNWTWPEEKPATEEDWVLGICFKERPTRGTTALRPRPRKSACSCACGGGSGCSCGSADSKAKNSRGDKGCCDSRASSHELAACEPTVVCEEVEFRVWRVESQDTSSDPPAWATGFLGDLYETARETGAPLPRKLLCCLEPYGEFAEKWASRPSNMLESAEIHEFRVDLLTIFREQGFNDCGLLAELESSEPTPALLDQLSIALQMAFVNCFCEAMRPPCPDLGSACVPLATITLARNPGCRVDRVCSWSNRDMLVSWPTIEYWLSLLFPRGFQSRFAGFCCPDSPGFDPPGDLGDLRSRNVRARDDAEKRREFSIEGVLRRSILEPFASGITPDPGSVLDELLRSVPGRAASGDSEEVAELRRDVEELRETVSAQQQIIERILGRG